MHAHLGIPRSLSRPFEKREGLLSPRRFACQEGRMGDRGLSAGGRIMKNRSCFDRGSASRIDRHRYRTKPEPSREVSKRIPIGRFSSLPSIAQMDRQITSLEGIERFLGIYTGKQQSPYRGILWQTISGFRKPSALAACVLETMAALCQPLRSQRMSFLEVMDISHRSTHCQGSVYRGFQTPPSWLLQLGQIGFPSFQSRPSMKMRAAALFGNRSKKRIAPEDDNFLSGCSWHVLRLDDLAGQGIKIH